MLKSTLLLGVGLATYALAAVTTPVELPDGTLVVGSGIGRPVVPLSGETWLVCGNDNPGGGDLDFNEPCASAAFGGSGTFDLSFLFATTAHFNTLGVQGQVGGISPLVPLATFLYTPGVEVVFDQFDTTLGVHFFSGTGAIGPEDNVWAQCIEGCPEVEIQTTTPEPSSFILVGIGLMLLGKGSRYHTPFRKDPLG